MSVSTTVEFTYGTIEEEILRIRQNKVLSQYLSDTAQKLQQGRGGCVFWCPVDEKHFERSGGIVVNPLPLNEAQLLPLS